MVALTGADGGESPGLRSPAERTGIDSDTILSYYQSVAADGAMSGASLPSHSSGPSSYTFASPSAFHSRSSSATSTATQFSTSSSSYSCDSLAKATSAAPSAFKHTQPRTILAPGLNGATRRPSIPSEGGADRRRMAIVDMGTEDGGRHCGGTGENPSNNTMTAGSSSSNLRSRRGIEAQLGGLALVAPPDASPQAYTGFTPPLSAPLQPPSIQPQSSSSTTSSHTRSLSEAVGGPGRNPGHVRKSSREVAVVGTTERLTNPSDPHLQTTSSPVTEALKPPIFQMPQSRSPSPGTPETSDSGSSTAPRSRRRKDALFLGVSPIKELKETLTPAASPVPPVLTPRIGESKNIGDRVAGPVIINIFPESPSPISRSSSKPPTGLFPNTNMSSPLIAATTPYLYYQPGLHAKAGPLPPPPMAVFSIDPRAPPPPRPPRHSPLKKNGEMEAMKQALTLPPFVAAALKARTPLTEPKEELRPTTSTDSPSSEAEKETTLTLSTCPMGSSPSQPVVSLDEPRPKYDTTDRAKKEAELPQIPTHTREGAFPPSRVCTTDSNGTASPDQTFVLLPRNESMDDLVASIGHAIDDMGIMRSSDVPPPTVLEPLRHNETRGTRPGLDIRRISFTPTPPLMSAESETEPNVLPPLPAKNERQALDSRVRSALSIKRFSSLPRPPSWVSNNRLSTGSKRSSRTPSPSLVGARALPPVEKVRSAWPPAMHFANVAVKKSALDRSLGYAQKINELYMYDSGLGDWVVETRYKSANPQKSGKRATVSPGARVPTTHSPRSQTRNISESSTGSEITFPRRPDAYVATDLSTPPSGDSSPPNAPPPLPYPGLAAAPRNGPSRASTLMASSSTSSGRSLTSPTSPSKSPASFFTSLGRKTSLKKDKVSPIAKVLSRSPPRSEPIPRPVIIPSAPSVPGGPRAPPHRMRRSQTIVISPQSSSNNSAPQRSSTVVQRPSQLGGRSTFSEHGSLVDPDEFARQVDKLSALLPRANRTVLEGYLRRAGQDILAIGQYLEDEKNGTLRYD